MKRPVASLVIASLSAMCLCGCSLNHLNVARNTTDQALLARLAAKDKDYRVRSTAFERITDQAALSQVAIHGFDSEMSKAAAERLTDQTMLAKVATEGTNTWGREAAIKKLTDQTLLATIAVRDWLSEARQTAIERLTDRTLVARLANEDKDDRIRTTAHIALVKLFTDQAMLAKIAEEDTVPGARSAAVSRITDQSLLAKLAVGSNDRNIRAQAIAALDPGPLLMRLAGDLTKVDCTTEQSVARMKLAMHEPVIMKRLPGVVFSVSISRASQAYVPITRTPALIPGMIPEQTIDVAGERVYYEASKAGKILAWYVWQSDFPNRTSASSGYIPAVVKGDEFLAALLSGGTFTPEDLTELLHASIPEVRIAAKRRLEKLPPKMVPR